MVPTKFVEITIDGGEANKVEVDLVINIWCRCLPVLSRLLVGFRDLELGTSFILRQRLAGLEVFGQERTILW